MDQKTASAYDDAATQLTDLRDACRHAGRGYQFQARLIAFREGYARRHAMMRRIKNL